MKRYTCTLLLFLLSLSAGQASGQSIWARATKAKGYKGWIDNNTATGIGDTLTVVIRESHKVRQEDKLDRNSSTTLAASLESFNIKPNTFSNVLPDFDVRSNRSQVGNAKQEKDQSFEARIAVTIVDKLPNGNLVISGRRTVVIDDERKTLKVSGIIRLWDVEADNTVPSDKVAEAQVSIQGNGKNTESITRGPIGKIIETAWWLIWPF